MLANSLIELDRAHLVHPVASYRSHEAMGVRVLKSARGATVTDATGHSLLDGFAGLWCVNVGYGQDSIVEAAAKQLRELPYATGYFGLGSEPAIRLAARLAELAPGDLNHIYFTLGGSDAVDSTIRFIRYYYHAKGTPQKDQFISVEYGYHGSSTTGSGLTAIPVCSMQVSGCLTTGSTRSRRIMPIAILPAPIRRRSSTPRWRPCGARSRNWGRIALPPSMWSRSRDREVCSFRRRAG